MNENSRIREAVEAVVAEAFDAHVRALHDDIVTRVIERLQPYIRSGKQASNSLKAAIEAIESGVQQTEILTALLDNAALFARRTALFVQRGTTAVGWQARGFEDTEAVKILSVDVTTGLAGTAIQQRRTAVGPVASFDHRLATGLGVPRDADCAIMPLVIRDRVAALMYAEGGRDGNAAPDIAAIEILVRTAGLWIEMQALRKASGAPVTPARPMVQATAPAVAREVPAQMTSPQPSSGQQGATAERATGVEYRAQYGGEAAPEQAVTRQTPPAAVAMVPSAAGPHTSSTNQHGTNQMEYSAGVPSASATTTVGQNTHENDELHKKARRFAKLLVDEIVLYNRAKVEEGRAGRNLYDRLKDDIDKSRATYDRRYAETPVAPHDYFTQALITGLAQHNPELLGPNFVHGPGAA